MGSEARPSGRELEREPDFVEQHGIPADLEGIGFCQHDDRRCLWWRCLVGLSSGFGNLRRHGGLRAGDGQRGVWHEVDGGDRDEHRTRHPDRDSVTPADAAGRSLGFVHRTCLQLAETSCGGAHRARRRT